MRPAAHRRSPAGIVSSRTIRVSVTAVEIGVRFKYRRQVGDSTTAPTVVDGTATFAFEGEGLRIRYVAARNMGMFDLLVDGVVLDTIDAYAPERDFPGTRIYTLGQGTHVLQIRSAGQKNPASAGFVVGLDAIQVYRADSQILIRQPEPIPTPSSTLRNAQVQLIAAPPTLQPTLSPQPPSEQHVSLVIAYDENGNRAVDPAEGVRDISVRVLDAQTNRVLTSGFTDARGFVALRVVTDSPTRLVVPYFGETWELTSGRGSQENSFTLLLDAGQSAGADSVTDHTKRPFQRWPIALFLLALACSGTTAAMQILDQPVYVCPTAAPVIPTPFPTFPPIPGLPTWVPLPTPIPPPSPTPYVIRPPQDFYVGDAVFTGAFRSSVNARFRLLNVRTLPASAAIDGTPRRIAVWDLEVIHRDFRSSVSARFRLLNVRTLPASAAIDGTPRRIAVWDLEVRNVGRADYDLLPAWQMYVSTVTTGRGDEAGIWGASRDAAAEAGIALVYEAITLPPGATRTFSLAAYIPNGTPKRLTYMLDPTTRESGARQPGSNPLIWINATNPSCSGDIRDPDAGGVLPTPLP